MKGLSLEIEYALNVIIEGLNYNFFSPDGTNGSDDEQDIETYVQSLEPERMKKIMDSKTSSFMSAKKILDKWMNSPNAPRQEVIRDYIERVVYAGESALLILRKALAGSINFDTLEAHKHDAAIKAKPLILEAIFDLDSSLDELRSKLDSDDLSLAEQEFGVGFAEKFAKGEFFPQGNYFEDWLNADKDAVRICPFSTSGKIITLDDLNIQLPKVPKDKSEILFSDLPKSEQYWKRIDVPVGITPDNKEQWRDYIKEEFRRRREGIWFMNNGEPVFLTGNHYFALQWCKMLDTGGYMDFRYAQLNMFYHLEACVIDDRCLGQLFVKSRRTGFTYIVLSLMLNASTGTRNNNFGITSKSDADAKKAFLKYRYMLLNVPFFFRPLIKGKLDSPKEFEFAAPLNNSKEFKKSQKLNADDFLNNMVDFQPTKDDSYDGQAMYMYLGDEAGKWKKPNDYINHFGQISPTMLEGGIVVGKAFIGSTVGSMSKGGEQFKEMHKSSDINKRNPVTEMTSSGLYRYFLPAQDNMTAFTDKYGVCHMTKPKVNTKNVKNKLIRTGSIEYLLSQEEAKRAESDKALNEQYRAFPRTIEHAFRDEAADSPFNITKLYEQIEYNDGIPQEQRYTVGNFEWVDGVIDGDVEFHPNHKGRFKVSWMPSVVDGTEALLNRVKEVGGQFYPMNTNVVRFGCDPFSYKSTHGKGSKGGIHGKTVTLPDGNAPKNEFVVEYIARPSDETIFFEDVIKCLRFYGAPILVESNRKDLLRHMYNRGYRGFSMDRLDRPKHKLNPDEKKYGGQMMSGQDIIDSHMGAIGTWIQNYVGLYHDEVKKLRPLGEMGTMPFDETLKDWLAFDPDNRTEFDATISSGLAIMACQEEKYKSKKVVKKTINISKMLPKYSNRGSIGTLKN
jgi:hypothetical protein